MSQRRTPLGELCILVKGKLPISKTSPGRYTLVTTGEEHKTADTFQFDAEAVCIPLISSTGHGHASLKRVHYQTGKFALGNLLAAALIKDNSILSAKYLTRYLMFTKDRLIVPLMTGAANMSISLDRLGSVPIQLPPLMEQERIVKLLDEADELQTLRTQADHRTSALLPALFHEMFGSPETGSHGFKADRLRNITAIGTGGTPSRNDPSNFGGNIPWVKTTEVNGTVITDTEEKLSDKGCAAIRGRLYPKGSIVVAMYGQGKTRGQCGVLGVEATANQACAVLLPSHRYETTYLVSALQLSYDRLRALSRGGNQANLNLKIVGDFEVLLPPLLLQKEFAQRVTGIRELETSQAASRQGLEALFQSMLHRAFNGELTAGVEVIELQSSPEFICAVLAAEIANRMHGHKPFGRVMLQKIIYLVEYHAQLAEIDSEPRRFAAGPHDPDLIKQVEDKMKKQDWYKTVPRQGSDSSYGFEYHPLAKASDHREHFEKLWPKQAASIRKLIDAMKTWKTERCERFATVYAAWNDLILWGEKVTDAAILDQVLKHWHPAKLKISKPEWEDTLSWMRREGYTPTGWGRPTAPKPQPELFPS